MPKPAPIRAVAALLAAIALLSAPVSGRTETFKSSEFLAWDRDSQSFYIQTSIGMAGLIAGFNDEAHARCVEKWYFDDTAKAEAGVRAAMERFPDYHPRGVLIAVVEKACGPFKYR